jgi:hypothetical protein
MVLADLLVSLGGGAGGAVAGGDDAGAFADGAVDI